MYLRTYFVTYKILTNNKLRLSWAKLKFSLVRAVTEDETEVIVGVWYLPGGVGWVGGPIK